MKTEIKNIVRDCTPPVLWRAAQKARRALGWAASYDKRFRYGAEQPPEYYDEQFHAVDHLCHHYTESHYYPLWSVIADRILQGGVSSIVDIGCGPGQIACLLRDKGVAQYHGVDFSPARIQQAKKVCPEFEFDVKDVFATDLLETANYDCVLILEFLEHVENDLDVLKKIKPGTRLLASVPNFPGQGHVRYFASTTEVRERYQEHLSSLRVDEHRGNAHSNKFFLMEGRI